ncbi:MAG TPA: DUF4386 domain-containing protein [Gemmatimonadaceae bacterium]|nr:DUF4386 domain-containing protein [Gemmatimonadaceae bacterium]
MQRTAQTRSPYTPATAPIGAAGDSLRKYSLAAGIFYLLTFVSIPTLALYRPVRAPGFITGSAADSPVIVGALLEMIVALAGIGTAVALYPVVRRQGQARAVGFVASRTLEAATIYVGIVSLMSIVSLRHSGVGSAASVVAQGLAAQYQWTFFFAQSFIPAVNGVLLGTLMYQSLLVPRWLPTLGLVGAALLVTCWFGVLFGLIDAISPIAALAALPIAVWEFSLGIYLTFWGFRAAPIIADMRPANQA